jgi:hypothetical protein
MLRPPLSCYVHQKTGNNYQTELLYDQKRLLKCGIVRKDEIYITMTLTREQLYQIYEDLQNAIKAGKGKREVTFERT